MPVKQKKHGHSKKEHAKHVRKNIGDRLKGKLTAPFGLFDKKKKK